MNLSRIKAVMCVYLQHNAACWRRSVSIMMWGVYTVSSRKWTAYSIKTWRRVPELSVLPLNSFLHLPFSCPQWDLMSVQHSALAHRLLNQSISVMLLISGEGNELCKLLLLSFSFSGWKADTTLLVQQRLNANVSKIKIWLETDA